MMTQYWKTLNNRQRYVVMVGGITAMLLLAYAYLWQPLSSHVSEQQHKLILQQSLFKRLIQAQHYSTVVTTNHTVKNASLSRVGLLPLVEGALTHAGLLKYTRKVSQISQNKLSLVFKQVPFDLFIQWLQTLSMQHGIRVSAITVAHTDKQGKVTINLDLMAVMPHAVGVHYG